MALWFPLRVNVTQIGHFEAQRIENGSIPDGGTVADAINTYRVTVTRTGQPSTEFHIRHRYGDGPWVLIATALARLNDETNKEVPST